MIPLFHDLTDARVLIFGGGPVGARKARRFTREAEVIVISPGFSENDYGGAVRIRASPLTEDIEPWLERSDPMLVVAATDDDDINEAVSDVAKEMDILVNRADVGGGREAGSVVVPATVRDDPVVIAIGTSGRSPELSRYLREKLQSEIEGTGVIAEVVDELRGELQACVGETGYRDVLRSVVTSRDVWRVAKDGGDVREAAEVVVTEELSDTE